jgi:hypothetical protein
MVAPRPQVGVGVPRLRDAEGAVEANFADEGVRIAEQVGAGLRQEDGEGSWVREREEGCAISVVEGVAEGLEDGLVVCEFGGAG